ncbi:DUF302 domain-containing protein [Planctomonas sp. JC2975]|uniref:DUF302 domain-containing protein n=1 Tax=Planctomonas sp. JC2975 TaxID=2729626 RepID=UPI001473B664|nr:DUF302 domain-containing protein [Planctomonas sp. JC2975]NNC10746.1 DUF302 domain-containing protein [Planctomonas sp. JC2975]
MNGPVVAEIPGSVADAARRLEQELAGKGIQLFATIDHAAGARAAGLELADEVVLVFGNPAVGTVLMQSEPAVGLDLPLRMLIWDDGGQTRVAYHDPRGLADTYGLSADTVVLDRLNGLLNGLAEALRS